MLAQLLADNPGVFSPELRKRIPTSIDMLQPSSNLLQTIRCVPIAPGVPVHSIVGVGGLFSLHGPSDGVVTAASAKHTREASRMEVDATHAWVHRQPETTAEVSRILQLHLQQAHAFMAPPPAEPLMIAPEARIGRFARPARVPVAPSRRNGGPAPLH